MNEPVLVDEHVCVCVCQWVPLISQQNAVNDRVVSFNHSMYLKGMNQHHLLQQEIVKPVLAGHMTIAIDHQISSMFINLNNFDLNLY